MKTAPQGFLPRDNRTIQRCAVLKHRRGSIVRLFLNLYLLMAVTFPVNARRGSIHKHTLCAESRRPLETLNVVRGIYVLSWIYFFRQDGNGSDVFPNGLTAS